MTTLEEAPPQPEAVGYQYPGFGNFARVPGDIAGFICELGFRIAYVENSLEDPRRTDVLLEPLQAGVRRYRPVQVVKRLDIRDINRLAP